VEEGEGGWWKGNGVGGRGNEVEEGGRGGGRGKKVAEGEMRREVVPL
jgi:hypothetical protein